MEYFKLEIESNSSDNSVVLTMKPNFRKTMKKFVVDSKETDASISLGGDIKKNYKRYLVKEEVKDVLDGGEILYSKDIIDTGKISLTFFGRKALATFVKGISRASRLIEKHSLAN
jgi:plasmid rolling circle replication initiator protein Rep